MKNQWFDVSSCLIDEALWVTDSTDRILYMNDVAEKMTGVSRNDALNNSIRDFITIRSGNGELFDFNQVKNEAKENQIVSFKDLTMISQKGKGTSVELKAEHLNSIDEHARNLFLVAKDLSKENDSNDLLLKSEQHYRMLIDNISDLISIISNDGIILYMSPSIEKLLGYSMEDLIGENALEIIHPDDTEKISKRFKSESENPNQIINEECRFRHHDGTWLTFESIGTKIFDENGELSSIVINSRDITERKKTEEELNSHRFHLEELVNERTAELGDTNKRLQSEMEMRTKIDDELKKSMMKLRKSISGTVQAIALTVETRDSYTAGHQRKVAQLSGAIARKMNLSDDQIEAIQMAGMIHDLGKIYIPSEILTRTGKLTDEEFNLIKIHPKVGFDILKNIEFPWPLDQMVYQHHERMNGSGYPLRLSGEDILIEARIIAVSDVVEAMTNHRPYRAALGLDMALGEVLDKRGTFFDPDVVDICQDLFINKGFEFK